MKFSNPTAAWHVSMAAPHQPSAQGLCLAQGAPVHVLSSTDVQQVAACLDEAQRYAEKGFWVLGWVAYEAAPAFDRALMVKHSHPQRPLVHFHVYAEEQVHVQSIESLCVPSPSALLQPWCDEEGLPVFSEHFDRVKQAIQSGEFYQINLTTRLRSRAASFDAWMLFQTLFLAQPAAQSVFMQTEHGDVLSVSPELFFRWNGVEIVTSPMKGTRRVANELGLNTNALRDSEKDRAENVMIVDLLRNDLSKICKPRTVQVRSLFDIMRLPTVEQMTSTIVGQTQDNMRLADVFRALFPCGSVTGAPKVQAMKRIAEWEASPRHLYCGALGVMHQQQVHFNVPIRTVWAEPAGPTGTALEYGVGSGITWYSERLAEKREWWQKTDFLRKSTVDFQVLETLRIQDGVWGHFEAHVCRMRQAALHFSFAWDEEAIRAQLSQVPAAYQQGVYRARWLLSADGALSVAFDPMPQPLKAVTLRLADRPIEVENANFFEFKTTHRPHYDAFLAQADGAFDVLLHTPEGRITETCRCNVVLSLDGQLWTPVHHAEGRVNLLAGVFRGHLLQEGIIREKDLYVEDLKRADAMWLINSLRAWIPVQNLISSAGVWQFPDCS